jgi:sigma-B regulation protein RsbQ
MVVSTDVIQRNNVRVSGKADGPVMLFAHGYGCDQSMWRLVAPSFEDHYRVVLFDHVGAGQSDLSAYSEAKYSRLQGYADDILEICEALGLRDVVFVGHSVSAMIGVLAARKDPSRFAKLVLIGPSPRYINDGDYVGGFGEKDIKELLEFQDSNYLGWSNTLAPVIMGNADRPELAQELNNSFCRTDPKIAKQFAAVTFLSDNRADLADVRVPSLILQCQEDAIAPLAVGEYLRQHLPHSTLHHLTATGHCPHVSAPHETAEAIANYLSS